MTEQCNTTNQNLNITMEDIQLTTTPPSKLQTIDRRKNFVNRNDLVRLIVQALYTLDYKESADLLEKESGIDYLSKDILQLKNCILKGDWNQSLNIIDQTLNNSNCKNINAVKYYILEEKYMEQLCDRNAEKALITLREEITPLVVSIPTQNNYTSTVTNNSTITVHNLQQLASYLVCTNIEDLKNLSKWKSIEGGSRNELLEQIQKLISPSLIIPENKLEQLLLTAVENQKRDSMSDEDIDENDMDESEDGVVLLSKKFSINEETSIRKIPNKILLTLEDHGDEVWICKFSNNGQLLATSSIDHCINIYSVEEVLSIEKTSPKFKLLSSGNVVSLCFSPDDKDLLAATCDGNVHIWNIVSGEQRACLKNFSNIVAAFWNESGNQFITISSEKSSQISVWEKDSVTITKSFKIDTRIQDASLLKDNLIIVATHERQLLCYNLEEKKLVEKMSEDYLITSLCSSKTGRFVLVSFCSEDEDEPALIHLWDLREKKIISTFEGLWSLKYVMRPIFMGRDLVSCGSEDCKIYIWNKSTGELIETLTGHSGVVNSVDYNVKFGLIASASDDTTVKIWRD
ncbi:WD40 repeat domain-containing protein [Naegleria gruberi]|uniref:WD40 repeat domain-containing protein n=1 Tax=Naegleria gruberi TaxID=5762 RepID=D2UXK1_NAEGR|nr:WD40 repeat domain-containing protein [Naegleria gruberi]EFC50299.1 WD40 repeat domain-containing protein [Naegleria gruberi]|eukprot:XP_002683043.1 WD40 repeat domain-containing protein [Naegleria gruberi strain NEG-M]